MTKNITPSIPPLGVYSELLNPWPWAASCPAPGLYFGMSFEEYLALPCLQSSSLRNLLIGATFFFTHSWMNPLCDEIDEDSKAKLDGRAYHARILEGKPVLDALYAPKYEYPGDTSELITTDDRVKEALISKNLPTTGKTKAERVERLIAHYPEMPVLDHLVAEYEARHAGKELIDMKTWRQMEFAAQMIERHPKIAPCFAGGYPEVTCIFWWHGVLCKCRFDYLKIGTFTDLKTFANRMKRSIERAVNMAFSDGRYHVSGGLYGEGLKAAIKFAADGTVFGADEVDPEWLAALGASTATEGWFVFQHKGVSPDTDWLRLPIDGPQAGVMAQGRALCEEAVDRFIQNYGTFKDATWINLTAGRILTLDDLPTFAHDL